MTKKNREFIYNKYNGHCAYCGKTIEYKDMQVDHLIPKRAYDLKKGEKPYRKKYKNIEDAMDIVQENDIENLMPSCRRCNHYKRANTLSTFRKYLLDMKTKLIDNSYLGKIAMDYKMITWNQWDGKFYFEKIK